MLRNHTNNRFLAIASYNPFIFLKYQNYLWVCKIDFRNWYSRINISSVKMIFEKYFFKINFGGVKSNSRKYCLEFKNNLSKIIFEIQN